MRGLYSFTVSLYANNNAQVVLEVNGELVVSAQHYRRSSDVSSGDAASAIVMLEAGDRVTCVKRDAVHELDGNENGYARNSFAGFLYTQL